MREENIVDAIEKGSVAFRKMFEAKIQYLISGGMKGEAKAVGDYLPSYIGTNFRFGASA
jgi:hypothetical protein